MKECGNKQLPTIKNDENYDILDLNSIEFKTNPIYLPYYMHFIIDLSNDLFII